MRRQAAAAGRGRDDRGARPRLGRGDEGRRHATRPAASRWRPPTRSTCSTPPAPPASRRASSATTAATPWRWPGRCRTSTTSTPGQVWWAASDVGWVVGHSYIVYAPLICGATTVLYEGKPVGTPGRRRVLAGRRRAPGRGAVHRADRDPGDQEGGPRRRRCWPTTTSSSLRTLFLAGERLDPDTYAWATEHARRAGGRQLVADRDRLADRGEPARPRADADQARLAVRAGAGVRRAGARPDRATRSAAGEEGAICLKLPLPPGTLPTLWGDDERFVTSYLVGVRRLLPLRRRRLRRRGRLRLRHGPHRRRHQRRRPPALDRLDGGGDRRAPGGRGVRGDRGGRPAQGPGAARASSCSRPGVDRRPRRHRRGAGGQGARRDRAGRGVQRRRGRRRRCRRPARARSCARRCARSPTARTPVPPSTIEDSAVLDRLRSDACARA